MRSRRLLNFAFVFVLGGTEVAAQDELRGLRDDLARIEVQNEEFKRLVPPLELLGELRAAIGTRARYASLEAEVGEVGKPEPVLLADGRPSGLVLAAVEVSGRDEYGDVGRFLVTLGMNTQIVRVESLRLTAAEPDATRFTIRLGVPYYAGVDPAPPSPGHDYVRIIRERLASQRLLRDLFLHLTQGGPAVLANELAAFTNAVEGQAVALSEVSAVGPDLTLKGVVAGAAARAALAAAPLHAKRVEIPDKGGCRRFVITAQLQEQELFSEPLSVSGNGVFDADARCGDGQSVARKPLEVRGTGAEGMTLRLHDIDYDDLFRVLFDLSGAQFVVDADVSGRVSMNLEHATIEEALAALRQQGILTSSGPLRRVSRATKTPAPRPEETYSGTPISLQLHDADLVDVLCLFSEITGLESRVAAGLQGKATIFVSEMEWDRAFAGLLAANGLSHKLDGNRVLIGGDALVDPCEVRPSTRGDVLAPLRLDQLDATDLTLVGVGKGAGDWKGYAYGPGRRWVFVLEPGQKLFDGEISAVTGKGVTIGTRELRLEP